MPSPLEPPVPCPEVFINEPFKHYPPCPSFDTVPPIPAEVITVVVGGMFILVALLLVIALVALTVSLTAD